MKQTWELMGKPKLHWSPIHIRMENQQKIFSLGRLLGVIVDIEGVCTMAGFKVIEIVDDNNPYPIFLRLNWVFDNMAIINLKKIQMIFKGNNVRVIALLDPSKGERYTKPDRQEYCTADIDNIYHLTTKE